MIQKIKTKTETRRTKNLLCGTIIAGLASSGLAGLSYADTSDDNDKYKLNTVVVTAQKREQDAQDIPVSINAFSGEEARLLAADAGALAGQSPGVEAYGNKTSLQSYFIRGIGLNEFAGNFNAPVALHYDEVYVSKNWQRARPNFDIARVEVLKGPQGTLFGRNTTGGAVNFFTAEPTEEFEGYIRGTADEWERYSLEGAVSGPLAENLFGRFSFYSGFGNGGPQENLFNGEDHGAPDVQEFRGQLLWELENTSVKALVYGGSDNSETTAFKGPGIFAPGGAICPEAIAGQVSLAPATCTKFGGLAALNGNPELELEPNDIHTINQNRPPVNNNDFYGGYLRIEHDFGDHTLTSITSYDNFTRDEEADSDSSPILSADQFNYNELDQFTQELRLSGSVFDGRSNYVVGVFYEKDDLYEVDSADLSQTPFNLPPANAGIPPVLAGRFQQDLETIAVFFNNDFDLTDRLTLTTGLRYTREETTIDAETNVGLNDFFDETNYPATVFVPGGLDTVNGTTSATSPSADGLTSNEHVDENVSWKLGLAYDVTDDILIYANSQTGFRTGGFSVPFGGIVVEFQEEEVLAFEAGFKSRLADDRVQLNGAVFRTETENAQVNVDDPLSPLVPLTRNLPKIETTGFEADVQVAVSEALRANFGVAYLDSEVTDSGGASISTIAAAASTPVQGNSPVNTPEWQLNGRFDYYRPISSVGDGLAVTASADFRWSDDRFLEITNQPSEVADAYTVANARLGLTTTEGNWDISVFVNNLTDEEYLVYTNNLPGPGFKLDVFGERRTIGISAGYNF